MNYYNEFAPDAAAWLRELINVGLIDAELDRLEKTEGFIADVVIVDYMDLIACEERSDSERGSINKRGWVNEAEKFLKKARGKKCSGIADKNGNIIFEGDRLIGPSCCYDVIYRYNGFWVKVSTFIAPLIAVAANVEIIRDANPDNDKSNEDMEPVYTYYQYDNCPHHVKRRLEWGRKIKSATNK